MSFECVLSPGGVIKLPWREMNYWLSWGFGRGEANTSNLAKGFASGFATRMWFRFRQTAPEEEIRFFSSSSLRLQHYDYCGECCNVFIVMYCARVAQHCNENIQHFAMRRSQSSAILWRRKLIASRTRNYFQVFVCVLFCFANFYVN